MFIEFQEIYIHIIILITTVLSFTNSLSRTSLYFSLKTSFVYSNLFSLAKTVNFIVSSVIVIVSCVIVIVWSTSLYLVKKWLLIAFLNEVTHVPFSRSVGRKFQSLVADTLKVLPPSDMRLYLGQTRFKALYRPLHVCKSALHLRRSCM